jgi:glucose dehydrogenase
MIDGCLTHVEGTSALGLYRGLKLKTAGTAWDVWANKPHADSIDDWPLPAVVTVSLPGLDSGTLVGHSIVVLGKDDDGKFEIADPFTGHQRWTRRQLIDAYGGDVMALVARDRAAAK